MKSLICLSIIIALVSWVAFSPGYRSGYARASKGAVVFERDTADTPGQGSTKTGYEPYFTRANLISGESK